MGALIVRQDSILLVERGRSPLKGYWSVPGGVLETGERLEEAVVREVREETGLVVKPLAVVEIFERIMRDRHGRAEYHYVLIDYLCKVVKGTPAPSDDARRVAWVRRSDLPGLKLTEGTLAVIEAAFRKREAMKRSG